jgi:hypothetical protein
MTEEEKEEAEIYKVEYKLEKFKRNLRELEKSCGQFIIKDDSNGVAVVSIQDRKFRTVHKILIGELEISVAQDTGLIGDPLTKPSIWVSNPSCEVIIGDHNDDRTSSISSLYELESLHSEHKRLMKIKELLEDI